MNDSNVFGSVAGNRSVPDNCPRSAAWTGSSWRLNTAASFFLPCRRTASFLSYLLPSVSPPYVSSAERRVPSSPCRLRYRSSGPLGPSGSRRPSILIAFAGSNSPPAVQRRSPAYARTVLSYHTDFSELYSHTRPTPSLILNVVLKVKECSSGSEAFFY